MPTRTGVLAVVAGVLTVLFGRFFGVLELYVVGAAAIVLPVVSLVRVHLARLGIRVRRQVQPDRVHAGTPAQVTLEVTSHHGTGELILTEPVEHTGGATIGVAPLRAEEVARARYGLPSQRRGVLSIGPLTATAIDPFGLATRTVVVAPQTEVLVYPRVDRLAPPRIGGASVLGAHLAQRALATAAGAEFHSQRTYVAGDDLRRVNWRASARSTDLVVRETTHDGRVLVHVVLDLVAGTDRSGDHDAFERAVSATASLAASAAEHDIPLRVELTDGTWFRGGAELVPMLLEHLALVQPDPEEVPAGGRADHDLLGVCVLVTADAPRRTVPLRSRLSSVSAATVVIDTASSKAQARGELGTSWFTVEASSSRSLVEEWNRLVGEPARSRGWP